MSAITAINTDHLDFWQSQNLLQYRNLYGHIIQNIPGLAKLQLPAKHNQRHKLLKICFGGKAKKSLDPSFNLNYNTNKLINIQLANISLHYHFKMIL